MAIDRDEEAVQIAEARRQRRIALHASGDDSGAGDVPDNALGLAFSGGGIRSATISLGAAQVLARHNRLLDFDYLSTVSGGGYIGSFLTSLFTPRSQRGSGKKDGAPGAMASLRSFWMALAGAAAAPPAAPAVPSAEELREKREFALKVLDTISKEREIELSHEGKAISVRHPVWWLREHSRYLAPNGQTDYAAAAYYMIRNWLGMLYVFALPVMLFYMLPMGLFWLALLAMPPGWRFDPHLLARGVGGAGYLLSPLLLFLPVPLFIAFASGVGFWLTEGAPIGRSGYRIFGRLLTAKQALAVYIAGTALAVGLAALMAWSLHDKIGDFLAAMTWIGVWLGAGGALLAAMLAPWFRKDGFSQSIRQRLTTFGSIAMQLTMVLLGLALIDMIALFLRMHLVPWWEHAPALTALPPVIAAAAAWMFHWLSRTTSDRSGGVFSFIFKHTSLVALVAGLLLYAVFAVLADLIVQFILWSGDPSAKDAFDKLGVFNGPGFAVAAIALLILTTVTGRSTGFINLSSLHFLYSTRLARAYVGATNVERLRDPSPDIKDVEPLDFIDVVRYQKIATGAPLHLINATLNETLSEDRSNLTDRDRKGVPITFGPEGIFANAARSDGSNGFKSWHALRMADVERLSIGQLCAISGAAASSGMGARTSLGTALALTFANVRLGYWWETRKLFRPKQEGDDGLFGFGTYKYLLAEMLGRYSRYHKRVYLSDGGHFENSGAYELLRRGTRAIVVCDNGADPTYQFEDLQNLVRKARIDLGLEIRVADQATVKRLAGGAGVGLFLNAESGQWRENARMAKCSGVALLLEVGDYAMRDDRRYQMPDGAHGTRHIIWIKPSLFPEMSEDLIGYAVANPSFPQQTTSDQFFDEAQWESYRMLGAVLMNRLLNGTLHKADLFRAMAAL